MLTIPLLLIVIIFVFEGLVLIERVIWALRRDEPDPSFKNTVGSGGINVTLNAPFDTLEIVISLSGVIVSIMPSVPALYC